MGKKPTFLLIPNSWSSAKEGIYYVSNSITSPRIRFLGGAADYARYSSLGARLLASMTRVSQMVETGSMRFAMIRRALDDVSTGKEYSSSVMRNIMPIVIHIL